MRPANFAKASVWLVVALVLGGTASGSQHFEPGSEKARWPIKTSLAEGIDPDKPKKAVKLADILKFSLPEVTPPIRAQDPRFAQKRIPHFPNPLGVEEGDIIAVDGYVRLVAADPDGDYHIQVAPRHGDARYECLIVELPRPEPRFVADAQLRECLATKRQFVRERLLKGKEPGGGGNVMRNPAYMRVTGQLFFDDWHIGGQRGKKGCSSPTLWEIHPVTDLRFAKAPQ